MIYDFIRTSDHIDELLNQCADSEENGTSKYPGMTYEQGIQAAIRWLTEQDESQPLED